MSDNLKVAKECGAKVTTKTFFCGSPIEVKVVELQENELEAYTSRILASQQAAHDAETARLKEEIDSWQKATAETENKLIAACDQIQGYLQQLSAANSACAIKDAALKDCLDHHPHNNGTMKKLTEAISASSEQVSEWERKQLEPIKHILREWREDHISDSQLVEFIDQFTKG